MATLSRAPVLSTDPALLEARLSERIAAVAGPGGGLLPPPVLIVAPTQRILDRLSLTLGRSLGAAVGLHLHHHHSLARAVLSRSPGPLPREIPAGLLGWALERPAAEAGDLDRYLAAHPAARDALLATFRDLRDAGIASDDFPVPRGLSATAGRTLERFREFQRWMQRAGERGLVDAAGLARLALPGLARFLEPFAEVHHHGAYDLTGVHEDLLHAVQQRVATTFWILGPGRGSADSPPRRLARTFSSAPPEVLEATAPEVAWMHAADPAAELRHALRRVLSWHARDGIALDDVAVLTRNPGAYAWSLRSECRRLGIPLVTTLRPPLRREPEAVRFRLLLEFLRDPEERGARERCRRSGGPEKLLAGRAQEWSALPSAAAALEWLASRAEELAPETLGSPLGEIATTFRCMEDLVPALPAAAALDLVLHWLDQAAAPERRPRSAGLPVLDLLQARGLPWRRAVWIGFNEGSFPRPVFEDPFLPDRDRLLLADHLGRKVPVKAAAVAEEQLLFDLVQGATQERLEISWARSDARGRSLAPSPLLHEFQDPAAATTAVPRHPRAELEWHVREFQMLTAEEALTLAALSEGCEDPSWIGLAGRIGVETGPLERSLSMVALTESFDAPCTDHDGAFGPRAATPWTATALALLGKCPLQFAFRHRLGIEPPDEPTDEAELTRLQFGILVHHVLQRVSEKLPARPAAAEVEACVHDAWDAELARLADERVPPELLAARSAVWREELLRFVTADRERQEQCGLTLHACEEKMELSIPVQDRALPVRIRIDRILRDAHGREWLDDYKTSSPEMLKDRAKVSAALRGKDLQLVLYWLARRAAGHDVRGLDYIAVAPRPRRDAPRAPDDCYFTLLASDLAPWQEELEDTLDALLEVEQRGVFPLVSGSSPGVARSDAACGNCGFRRACRHTHMPTVLRVEAHPAHQRFYALRRKKAQPARVGS